MTIETEAMRQAHVSRASVNKWFRMAGELVYDARRYEANGAPIAVVNQLIAASVLITVLTRMLEKET